MNAYGTFFSETPLDHSAVLRPAVCRSCGGGVVVPATARFCPRCGTTFRAVGISPPEADAVDRFAAIREAEQAHLPPPLAVIEEEEREPPPFARLASDVRDFHAGAESSPGTPPPLPPLSGPPLRNFHSDVLVAYATALFRLGWRYERGRGSPRNLAEAIRCYYKSARLGNHSAAARLEKSLSVSSTRPPG